MNSKEVVAFFRGSTQGEWLGTVVHNPWGAREQPQDQEGIVQSDMEMPMQRMGHPLNEDTADKDSLEGGVMASEEKAPLIEDKTQGLEGVLKMEQEPRAEEDSLTEEQALRELGAREQPQNHEETGQSFLKRDEQENGAEEGSSKVEQVLMGLVAMEQPQKQDGSGQSWEKKGMVSLQDRAVVRRPMAIDAKPASNTGAQSKGNPSKGLVQCFWGNRYGHTAVKCEKKANPRLAGTKDALADKAQKAATAIQVLALKDMAGLTARPSKCVIGAKTVQLLGHHAGYGVLGLGRDHLDKVG